MKNIKISKKGIYVLRIYLIFAGFISSFFISFFLIWSKPLFSFLALCWFFTMLFLWTYYIPVYVSKISAFIENGKIWYTSGVFWVNSRCIPLERIQLISAQKGIFERFFKIFNVTVRTTGGKLQIAFIDNVQYRELLRIIGGAQ